jgi:hypothetical protein
VTVRPIVPNAFEADLGAAQAFGQGLLGLDVTMDPAR